MHKKRRIYKKHNADDQWDLGRVLADPIRLLMLYMAAYGFLCHGEPEGGAWVVQYKSSPWSLLSHVVLGQSKGGRYYPLQVRDRDQES